MKTPLFLAALALALVAQDAAAQTLAGTMAAGAIGSSLQGIGGMNYGAIKTQARGVSNANNNYQSTLNGLMTDPNNTTTAQQQPPPPPQPPPQPTGVQAGTQTGGAGANTNLTSTSTRPISTWGATGLASLSANPRNIMSTIGNNSAGTNQLSSRPRISLRVQTMRISNPRTSGISTRGGATGGATGGAGGGQQQQGGAGGGQQQGGAGGSGQQQGGAGGGQQQQGGGAPPALINNNPNPGGTRID